jgi:4'-phosphopantetheinyl transferase
MSIPIYWMLAHSDQATGAVAGVLSPAELERYYAFRFPKRRDEWFMGRWAAKALTHSLPAYRQYRLDQIEVCNAPEGVPFLQLSDRAAPAECLSISHSGNLAVCALAPGLGVQVGVDLEKVEARTETFILDYFTPAERQLVDRYPDESRAMLVTLIWSAKESMLKALGVGLRRDTRLVEVQGLEGRPPGSGESGGWQKLQVGEQPPSERAWAAWWQHRDPYVLTLAGFAATPAGIQSVQLLEQQVES